MLRENRLCTKGAGLVDPLILGEFSKGKAPCKIVAAIGDLGQHSKKNVASPLHPDNIRYILRYIEMEKENYV
jgi:hypothetical protein